MQSGSVGVQVHNLDCKTTRENRGHRGRLMPRNGRRRPHAIDRARHRERCMSVCSIGRGVMGGIGLPTPIPAPPPSITSPPLMCGNAENIIPKMIKVKRSRCHKWVICGAFDHV